MKKLRLIFFSLLLLFTGLVYAQNPIYFESNEFDAPTGIQSMSVSAGDSYIITKTSSTTGSRDFRFRSSSGGGWYFGPDTGSEAVTLEAIKDISNVDDLNYANVNVADASYNYVFKTNDSKKLVVFEVQGDVRTISSVTRNHYVQALSETMTITATLSGALNTGQGVYLRWTDDNWSTSTITEMTFSSGSDYTADIPAQTMSETVKYYVFTSGDGLTISTANADLYTINRSGDASSNAYTYIVARSTTSAGGPTNWNYAPRWQGSTVPQAGDNIVIRHTVTLNINSNNLDNITIVDGGTLNFNEGINLNIASGGTIDKNGGTFNCGLGKTIFVGGGSVTGTICFNDVELNGAVDFGTASSVGGTLEMKSGSSVTTNPPTYNSGSTLLYTTSMNRGLEWSTNNPYNVTIENSSTLNMSANGTSSKTVTNNLTIADGNTDFSSTLNMGTMDGALIVNGNFIVYGYLTASSVSGGDIEVKGDLRPQNYAGALTISNGRKVTLNGSSLQTITDNGWAGGLTLDNLIINNAAGVSLGMNITIDDDLKLTSGVLDIGSKTLTLNNACTVTGTHSNTAMIKADGTGVVKKMLAAGNLNSAITMPIGSNSGSAEYSPVTITLNSPGTTLGTTPYLTFNVTDTAHPNNPTSPARTDYLNRYWSIANSDISAIDYDLTLKYVDADITGTESDIFFTRYYSSTWYYHSAANTGANTISASGLTQMSDFTGFNQTAPGISIADDGSITEGSENGEVITVTLTSGTLENPITPANWSLSNLPTGVSKGTVTRTSDTTATISLSGNATTDYDTNITNLTVTVTSDEFVDYSGSSVSDNSGVTFTATNDAESISLAFVGDGSEATVTADNEYIDVTLTGGDFITGNINGTNVTLDPTCSAAIDSLALGAFSNITTSSFRVRILDTSVLKDYDSDLTFTLLINGAAYNDGASQLSESITLVATVEGVSLTASDDGSISEGSENNEVITMVLSGDNLNTSTPATIQAGLSLTNAPTGISVGTVTYTDNQNFSFVLSGNRTVDYDTSISNMVVTVDASILIGSVPISTNGTGVTFVANNDAESIAFATKSITEGSENGEVITVNLTGGTFVNSLNASNWTVTNLPTGVSWGSLTRVSSTQATFALSGNRTVDYDTDITNLTVEVTSDEYDDASSGSISDNNGITFTATNDAESIALTYDGTITEGSENGEVITVTLTGGTFVDPINTANFSISNAPTGVSKGTVTRTSATTVTIALSGNRTVDYDANITNFTVTIQDSEIEDHSGSTVSANSGVTFTARNETISISGFPLNFGDRAIGSDTDLSYTLSASGLTGDLTITPPTMYEVSESAFSRASLSADDYVDNDGDGLYDFVTANTRSVRSNLVISPDANGTISSRTIYVRYHPTSTGTHNGNIEHTAFGATQQDGAVTGSSSTDSPTFSSTANPYGVLSHRCHVNATISSLGNPVAQTYGFVWSTSTAPTYTSYSGRTINSSPATGEFIDTALSLTSNTTYYIRPYMRDGFGTVTYGPEKSFSTTVFDANKTETGSISNSATPVSHDFTNNPMTLVFSNMLSGGTNCITSDIVSGEPTGDSGSFSSDAYKARFSLLITNNTQFDYNTVELRLNLDEFQTLVYDNNGVFSKHLIRQLNDGDQTEVTVWNRSVFTSFNFSNKGNLRYRYVDGGSGDYLYIAGLTSISELTFTGSENQSLPVDLSSFSVNYSTSSDLVEVAWETQSESQLAGYFIYRSTTPVLENASGLTPNAIAANNSDTEQHYLFKDADIESNTRYYYWLQSMNLNSTYEFHGPIRVDVVDKEDNNHIIQVVKVTSLIGNYPNPFNPSTEIRYYTENASDVSIDIYNLKGQKVKGYKTHTTGKGYGTFTWNGKDFNGKNVASGVYFYKMKAGKYTEMKKMIMLK